MTDNELNRKGIFQIPYHENFRIDGMRNIYIMENGEIQRTIPSVELKFVHLRKVYYTIDLYCLAYFGLRNPFIYETVDLETSNSFIINGIVFKKIDFLPEKLRSMYGISANGIIFSNAHKRIRKREIDEDGYIRISWPYSNLTHVGVHRLVYSTWIGRIPDDMLIDHIDNNKWNNSIDNLRVVTLLENSRKAANDGLYKGYMNLNENKVHEICKMLSNGHDVQYIAGQFGIDRRKDPKIYKRLNDKIRLFIKYKNDPTTTNVGWKDIIDQYDIINNNM